MESERPFSVQRFLFLEYNGEKVKKDHKNIVNGLPVECSFDLAKVDKDGNFTHDERGMAH